MAPPLFSVEQLWTSARDRLYRDRIITSLACWEWTGYVGRHGYGVMAIGHRDRMTVPRVSWRVHYGEVPPGLCVLHRCDNKLCGNPEHLFLGDHQANTDDKLAKKRMRHGHLCGAANPGARLDWDKVEAIRRRCDAGETTYMLAVEFGINQALVWRVWRRRSWRHPPDRQVVVMSQDVRAIEIEVA